jgi:glycosyltransferase involved in cell wall biosynthesis
MKNLSAIILTKDEEKNIKECIESVSFADEVVIIDDDSTDKTRELAKNMGALVYRRTLDDFASQRNFGISKATGKWLLFIDADERVSQELAQEIREKVSTEKEVYYKIPRKNNLFGKYLTHTDWYPDYQHRLFKQGEATWGRKVHEQLQSAVPGEEMHGTILHDNYSSINQFVEKNFGMYADYESNLLISAGYKFSWPDLITKPVNEFLRRFFAAEGYKDGVHGLVASLLVASATCIVYAKVWEKEGFTDIPLSPKDITKTMKQNGADVTYWMQRLAGRRYQVVHKLKQIMNW